MQTPLQAVSTTAHQDGHGQTGSEPAPRSASVASLPVLSREAHAASADADYSTIVRQLDVMATAFIPAGVVLQEGLSTASKAAVVVCGEIRGEIDAGDKPVYVMQGGLVTGPIRSSSEVVVAGTVGSDDGKAAVITDGRFVLAGSGTVRGDVQYRSLRVHDGGTIAGRLLPVQPAGQ